VSLNLDLCFKELSIIFSKISFKFFTFLKVDLCKSKYLFSSKAFASSQPDKKSFLSILL
jgi:hypothetical protein